MTRGLNGVVARRELLDPRRHGFYALQLVSHKVLRRLMALPLALLAVTSAAEARHSRAFRALAVAQGALYAAGAAGLALRVAAGRARGSSPSRPTSAWSTSHRCAPCGTSRAGVRSTAGSLDATRELGERRGDVLGDPARVGRPLWEAQERAVDLGGPPRDARGVEQRRGGRDADVPASIRRSRQRTHPSARGARAPRAPAIGGRAAVGRSPRAGRGRRPERRGGAQRPNRRCHTALRRRPAGCPPRDRRGARSPGCRPVAVAGDRRAGGGRRRATADARRRPAGRRPAPWAAPRSAAGFAQADATWWTRSHVRTPGRRPGSASSALHDAPATTPRPSRRGANATPARRSSVSAVVGRIAGCGGARHPEDGLRAAFEPDAEQQRAPRPRPDAPPLRCPTGGVEHSVEDARACPRRHELHDDAGAYDAACPAAQARPRGRARGGGGRR